MRKLLSVVILSCATILISCGGNSKDGKGSSSSSSGGTYNYENRGFVHDQKAIEKAFEELRNMDKFKGKKIMVFQNLRIQDYGVDIEISNPDIPTNVDKYEYTDGEWSAPQAVQFRESIEEMKESINDNLTDLDKIAINKIADMVKITDEKAKTIEGAKPCTYIAFNLFVPNQIREFVTTIKGTRTSETLKFTPDGVLKQK